MAEQSDHDEHDDVAGEFFARAMKKWAGKGSIKDDAQRKEAQSRIEARRKHERPLAKATDGRRLRATGRTAQFNIKVKPDWAAEIAAMAGERDIGKAELLERIVAEWKALGGKADT